MRDYGRFQRFIKRLSCMYRNGVASGERVAQTGFKYYELV